MWLYIVCLKPVPVNTDRDTDYVYHLSILASLIGLLKVLLGQETRL